MFPKQQRKGQRTRKCEFTCCKSILKNTETSYSPGLFIHSINESFTLIHIIEKCVKKCYFPSHFLTCIHPSCPFINYRFYAIQCIIIFFFLMHFLNHQKYIIIKAIFYGHIYNHKNNFILWL